MRIKTPEGIVFSFEVAGPLTRFLAWLIDFTCILAISSTIGTVLGTAGLLSADLARALSTLSYFVISIGYGVMLEWRWRGQTVGKRLLHLRVMDAHALRLQFNQVLIRNLLRFVDMLPALYLVGGITSLLNRRGQRLGDLAANTVVIHHPQVTEPDLDQLMAGKFNSLRAFPHLEARLRQRVSPDEARIALQAIVRRDEFDPGARVELFRELAAHFKALVTFPDEATEFLTNEQYIRNVVDIVFRSHGSGNSDSFRVKRASKKELA